MSKNTTQIQQRIIVFSLVGLYLLLAFAWQGIRFADESDYLYAGIHFQPSMFVHQLSWVPLWSPLYGLWFKALSLVVHDPARLYFVSWTLLVVVVSSIPLWMRMRSAWLYTLFLVSFPFFSVWPYVSLFVSAFFVAGMCLIWRRNLSISSAMFTCGLITFLAAFARPEFEYGFVLTATGSLLALAFDKARTTPAAVATRATSLLLLSVVMFFVMKQSSSLRSGVAFAQHYNLRATETGQLISSAPMLSNYAQQTFRVDAGQPNINNLHATLGDFFRANPRLFLKHVLRNARDPRTVAPIVFILALCAWIFRTAKDQTTRAAAAFLLSMSLPVFAGMILIFPREHYTQILVPTVVLLLLQVFANYLPDTTPPATGIIALGLCLMLLGTAYRVFHKKEQVVAARSNRNTVLCMRDLEQSSGVGNGTMFNTFDVSNVYLNVPRHIVTNADIHDWPGFTAWARQNRPGWIILNGDSASVYNVSPAEISSFVEQEMHYTPHPCPRTQGVTVYTAPQL